MRATVVRVDERTEVYDSGSSLEESTRDRRESLRWDI